MSGQTNAHGRECARAAPLVLVSSIFAALVIMQGPFWWGSMRGGVPRCFHGQHFEFMLWLRLDCRRHCHAHTRMSTGQRYQEHQLMHAFAGVILVTLLFAIMQI